MWFERQNVVTSIHARLGEGQFQGIEGNHAIRGDPRPVVGKVAKQRLAAERALHLHLVAIGVHPRLTACARGFVASPLDVGSAADARPQTVLHHGAKRGVGQNADAGFPQSLREGRRRRVLHHKLDTSVTQQFHVRRLALGPARQQ